MPRGTSGTPVGVRRYPLAAGEQVDVPTDFIIALDGERERRFRPQDRVVMRLNPQIHASSTHIWCWHMQRNEGVFFRSRNRHDQS